MTTSLRLLLFYQDVPDIAYLLVSPFHRASCNRRSPSCQFFKPSPRVGVVYRGRLQNREESLAKISTERVAADCPDFEPGCQRRSVWGPEQTEVLAGVSCFGAERLHFASSIRDE